VAVIEVGMGGRMDATNVADGLVSVLTRVDLEHTEHLGKTVNRIAREKAGIVKPSSRAVTVAQPALSVIEARCREVHAPLLVVGRDVYVERGARDLRGQDLRVRGSFGEIEVHTPLRGDFQAENVALAVTALTELRQQFFFSSRRRHTRCLRDWSSDVCSSDLLDLGAFRQGDAVVRT